MIDEIVSEVCAKTGMSPEQARGAVDAVLGFLKSRLPEPLAGAVGGILGGDTSGAAAGGGADSGIEGMLEGKAMSALEGLFGAKS